MAVERGNMSFLQHLEVLRWHLVRSVAAIFTFAIIAFVAKSFVFDSIILAPKNPDFPTYSFFCEVSKLLGMDKALCIEDTPFTLLNVSMAGQFSTHMWVSLVAGFILAFPYVLWEIWRFIKPGLKSKEQKYTRGVVFFSSLLFMLGVLFGYYVIAPLSVNFLGTYQVSADVPNNITLGSFISTVTTATLASGIVFELPMVVYFLSKIGLLSPVTMRKYRKHSIIGVVLLSAIITPPDVFSQILVSLPLMILYEVSIKISGAVIKNKK